MSRGATVRKKKSREQTEARVISERIWFSLFLPSLGAVLINPAVWFWTLRDLALFFSMRPAVLAATSVALFECRDARVWAAAPVVCFIGIW